jgi:hypothetical protein
MRILTPEDLAQKYPEFGDPSNKKVVGRPGQADLAPTASTTALSMTQREYESYAKRGINIDPENPQNAWLLRAEDQSSAERAGNAIVRGTIGALGVMLEDASYMTLQPLGEVTGVLGDWEQNLVAQWGKQIKEYGHEAFPHYTADPSKISWSPWAILGDLIENGLGFAVPGVGISKAVGMGTRALRATKVKQLADAMKKAAGASGSAERAANFILPGMVSNWAEGSMMGFETYQGLIDQGYSVEEATSAADEVRRTNMALMFTDMIQLHGVYQGTKAMRNTMRNPAEWRQNLKAAFTTANADNPVFQAFVEGGEEIFQGIIQREAENKITVEGKELRKEKDIFGRIGEYLQEESVWYEGALGFLSGGAQQVLMKEMGNAIDRNKYNKIVNQINAIDAEIATATNAETKSTLILRKKDLEDQAARTTQQGMYESQQKLISETEEHIKHRYQKEIELNILAKQALEAGDTKAYEQIQSAKFSTIVYDNMVRGTLDTLERSLEDMMSQQLSKEELEDKGWDENYKEKIQSDIKLIKTLEQDFIESQNYLNPSEVYHAKQKIRVTQQQLNGTMSRINDILNGTKNEKGEVETHGLKATAERIANELKASEFNFNKFMAGGLKLGDIENEAERNKLSRALDKIKSTKEYKDYLVADEHRKDTLDELDADEKFLVQKTSKEYQQKYKDLIKLKQELQEKIKKANKVKQDIVDSKGTEQESEKESEEEENFEEEEEATSTETEEETEETVETEEEVESQEGTDTQEDSEVVEEEEVEEEVEEEITDGVKSSEDKILSKKELDDLQEDFEKHEATAEQFAQEESNGFGPKITVNQREFKKDKDGRFTETEDDFRKDKEGNYLEDIINLSDPSIQKGTELIFEIVEDQEIFYNGKLVKYSDYESSVRDGKVNTDLIPIRIMAKKGDEYVFIGWVESGKNATTRQLRDALYDMSLNGNRIAGEITYKYDGTLFKLKDKKVMNGEVAFPASDDLAVIGKNGEVFFSGKEIHIPDKFKKPGYTVIALPDGRFVATYPNKIDESHADIIVDALEIFVRLGHSSNANKSLEEILNPELLKSYKALVDIGYDLRNSRSVNQFVSMYMMTITPDKRWNDLSAEERNTLGLTSSLAKYAVMSSNGPNSTLGDKPMLQVLSNGISFLSNTKKTAQKKIGYSISSNSPIRTLNSSYWRTELKKVVMASYRNTDTEHLNKEVIDIQKDKKGKIITTKIPYNKLAKSGVSVRHKSINLGTEEEPNWTHTVNPVVRFRIKKEGEQEKTSASTTQTAFTTTPASAQPQAQTEEATPAAAESKEEVSNLAAEIYKKVEKEEMGRVEAMEILDENGLSDTPEYESIYKSWEADNVSPNFEADNDIILSNIPQGDNKIINSIQRKLLNILKSKNIMNKFNIITNSTDFIKEVNKLTAELNQNVKDLLSLGNEFGLKAIASEKDGKVLWNMNSLAFVDFAHRKFTKTNMKLMSEAMVRETTKMMNGEDISEFLRLSKIHFINCK